MAFCLMEGNEAIAWGAVASECRFFAGYPITPATTIFNTLLELLPPLSGICLQGEDEIASIGYCLGASMAGLKVMTATSGPGISLYSEHISFAIGSEIPIVIVARPVHGFGHPRCGRRYSIFALGQQRGVAGNCTGSGGC